VRLLLYNAPRVDEACSADITDLGQDSGHRVLRVVCKGVPRAKIPLTPATVRALVGLPGPPERSGRAGGIAAAERAAAGHRHMDGSARGRATCGELVRRLIRTAGISAWEQAPPHSLRHSAITFALEPTAPPARYEDYVGHKGPPHHPPPPEHSRDSMDRDA
jgi:integrase/recombinase XerD